ncbi:acyl carrier protein [Pygmaiobacter massiliensis]|uniref:acyl carrier protein n=1 Tax=Pygmaiobacter massiliensis TaxID=1917873 RepID=UPI000C7C4C5A|nr:acyl carrier protein [Pygmaiobacter massiliensis]MDY4783312.1 acyl carrier protein [Pygmaiobacter massiliensis]
MEKLIEILKEIREDVDYTTCTTLIDDGIFDSFDIIQTINELNEAFEIEIPATEIIPENFNSAQTLWDMICRLREE